LAAEKNLAYLTRAAAQAVQELPGMKFVVAGEGALKDEMVRIFQEYQIEDRLVLAGSLSGSDLADCYAAMDVFVFASQSETQGLVLAEAMAASVPVIALSATGVDDVLADRINGIKLAAESSVETFSTAIVCLLKDQELYRELRSATAETAQKYSRKSSCKALIQLYESVINEKKISHRSEIDLLDSVMISIKAEWELLQEKTAAALNTIAETE